MRLHQIKKLCTAKIRDNRTKGQLIEWEKIFTRYSSGRELIFSIHKKLKRHKKEKE
jgi:hypothetical protein